MSWTAETNIKGPKGDKGDTGAQGPPGTSGTGTGNVTGPAGAVDNNIAVYNGTTGTVIKDGGQSTANLALKTYVDSQDALKADKTYVDSQDALKVAKAGDTMTGNLIVSKANPSYVLQKTASGQANQIAGYNDINPRWSITLGDSAAESGSNAGSNFGLYRFTDAGTQVDAPLTVARSSGVVNFTQTPTVVGVPISGGGGSAVYKADTAPAGAPDGALWVESDSGLMFFRWNDGTSTQWVAVPGGAGGAVLYTGPQNLTANQMAQARSNIAVTKRNYILNGAFTIQQDTTYVSGAVLAAGAYGHDQWKAGAGGGDYTFTQLKSSTTVTIAAGKSLIQPIEDARVTGGGSYVLAWTGTAQARAGVNTLTPSGAYAASPLLITGQTDGTVMSVEFNTGTLGNVGLYEGNVAPPFMVPDYASELALCRRYWQLLRTSSGQFFSTTGAATMVSFDPMRIAPTATIIVGTNAVITPAVASYNITAITQQPAGTDGGGITFTTSTAVTNNPVWFNPAAGKVSLNARL